MDTHFKNAKRKVERAISHINSIEKWLWTINEDNAKAAIEHHNEHLDDEPVMLLMKRRKGYSDHLGPVIGDGLHNLRAALDSVAWSIVTAGGRGNPERSAFPLFPDDQLQTSQQFQM
jgi:hypothetical protein